MNISRAEQEINLQNYMKRRELNRQYSTTSYKSNSVRAPSPAAAQRHPSAAEASRMLAGTRRQASTYTQDPKTEAEHRRRLEHNRKYSPGAYRQSSPAKKTTTKKQPKPQEDPPATPRTPTTIKPKVPDMPVEDPEDNNGPSELSALMKMLKQGLKDKKAAATPKPVPSTSLASTPRTDLDTTKQVALVPTELVTPSLVDGGGDDDREVVIQEIAVDALQDTVKEDSQLLSLLNPGWLRPCYNVATQRASEYSAVFFGGFLLGALLWDELGELAYNVGENLLDLITTVEEVTY